MSDAPIDKDSLVVRRRTTATAQDVDSLHTLIVEMVDQEAALGWVEPPSRSEIGNLVADLVQGTDRGDACLVLVETEVAPEQVLGFAYWTRRDLETEQVHADIGKVGLSSRVRGGGFGRRLVETVVQGARDEGIEVVTLDVRGNNHAAMALYERLGFVEYGRIPNFVAIGDERWDNVFMSLDLRSADHDVVLHGDAPRGAGSSTRSD